MWKTSARITSFHNLSVRRAVHCNKDRLCSVKVYNRPGQTRGTRHFSNGGTEAGSGAGKAVLGTTLLVGAVIGGGIYYSSTNPKFRQTVENKVPYSSAFFNATLGKSEQKQTNTPKKAPVSNPKKSSENNLLPITGKELPVIPKNEDELEKPDLKPPEVKISPPVSISNVPATVSSLDQIGVSSVDLDISKAVEKGISDGKKENPPILEEVIEVSNGEVGKDITTEEKCSECENDKDGLKVESPRNNNGEIETSSEIMKDDPNLVEPLETKEVDPIEIALHTAIATISDLGQKAIDLHEQAVIAVQHHRDSVKEALERSEKDGVSNNAWELLSKLSDSKTQALGEAEQISARLTDLVESVQRNITKAKAKGLDSSAEVASETLAKLTYALQQAKSRLSESQAEGSVLKTFQEFIKEEKEHQAQELAAIRREFEIDTLKDKADAALLAYAQKRIRLLEDTIQEREHRERKLLEEALKKQENEQEKLSAMRLQHELEKLKTELNSLMKQREAEDVERHENDLRTQLRRQAAAFSDHLNEVLKVQENELNTKHDGVLREKLLLAQQESELKLRGSLARLNGIITAIRNKADTEKYNVEAQRLWVACQSLSTAIIGLGDSRDHPYPILSEVDGIRRVTDGNEVVGKILDSLSDDALKRGVYTEESLRRRFTKVKQVCREVAMIGEDGGGVWSYLVSYLQSLFVFETRTVTPQASIDPDELDTYKILALATCALENDDTEQAVRYMNQLTGEPRRIAKDWIQEARLFLEAKQAARFLTSFASAYNIGVEQQE